DALEAAFAAQLPSGDFRRVPTAAAAPDTLMEDAAWIAGLTRALIAVMNSDLAERFRWRYAIMRPRLQRSIDYLEARAPGLTASHADRPGALMVIAAAFLLADGSYHDPRYGRAGQVALAAAIDAQAPDGRLARGGPDPV